MCRLSWKRFLCVCVCCQVIAVCKITHAIWQVRVAQLKYMAMTGLRKSLLLYCRCVPVGRTIIEIKHELHILAIKMVWF